MHNGQKLAISLALPFLIALLGSLSTTNEINTWYATLEKPTFSPPNWLFGPVWTLLYFLMGIALYLSWQKQKLQTLSAYFIQLGLNAAWSPVFFALHAPLAAFLIIVLLWLAIIATIIQMKPNTAKLLMAPYLLWVTFASVLNLAIVILN